MGENCRSSSQPVPQPSYLELDGDSSSHQSDEFIVIDVAITISISLSHQGVEFLLVQWFTTTRQDVTHKVTWYGSCSFLVENHEGIFKLLIGVLWWFQAGPDTHELEVDFEGHHGTIFDLGGFSAVGDFSVGGVPSHGVHHFWDFTDADGIITGFIKHFKDFRELFGFLGGQFCHDYYFTGPALYQKLKDLIQIESPC